MSERLTQVVLFRGVTLPSDYSYTFYKDGFNFYDVFDSCWTNVGRPGDFVSGMPWCGGYSYRGFGLLQYVHTTIGKTLTVRLPWTPDIVVSMMSCNYMGIRNLGHGDLAFGAFIHKISYVSDSTCEVEYSIDVLSTYISSALSLSKCLVRRSLPLVKTLNNTKYIPVSTTPEADIPDFSSYESMSYVNSDVLNSKNDMSFLFMFDNDLFAKPHRSSDGYTLAVYTAFLGEMLRDENCLLVGTPYAHETDDGYGLILMDSFNSIQGFPFLFTGVVTNIAGANRILTGTWSVTDTLSKVTESSTFSLLLPYLKQVIQLPPATFTYLKNTPKFISNVTVTAKYAAKSDSKNVEYVGTCLNASIGNACPALFLNNAPDVADYTFNVNHVFSFDKTGYSKLNKFPFSRLLLRVCGEELDFDITKFSTSFYDDEFSVYCRWKIQLLLFPTPAYVVIPVGYGRAYANSSSNRINPRDAITIPINGGLPFSVDSAANFYSTQWSAIQTQKSGQLTSAGISALTNIVSSTGSIAMGNVGGAGGLMNTVSSFASTVVQSESAIKAAQERARDATDKAVSSTPLSLSAADYSATVQLIQYSLASPAKDILTEYFATRGVYVGETIIPQTCAYSKWDYVEIPNASFKQGTAIPDDARNIIRAALARGLTIYHDADAIGNQPSYVSSNIPTDEV